MRACSSMCTQGNGGEPNNVERNEKRGVLIESQKVVMHVVHLFLR